MPPRTPSTVMADTVSLCERALGILAHRWMLPCNCSSRSASSSTFSRSAPITAAQNKPTMMKITMANAEFHSSEPPPLTNCVLSAAASSVA